VTSGQLELVVLATDH